MATLYKFRSGTIPAFSAKCNAPMTDRRCIVKHVDSTKQVELTLRIQITDEMKAALATLIDRLAKDGLPKETWLDKMRRLRALKPHIT